MDVACADGTIYYNECGTRLPVHGNTRWTASAGNVKMRGTHPLPRQASPLHDSFSEASDEVLMRQSLRNRERDELELAIAASLQDGPVQDDTSVAPAAQAAPAPADESMRSMCVVCLTQPVDHMIRACNHACVCVTCAPRLDGSCPICRERITSVERIWLA